MPKNRKAAEAVILSHVQMIDPTGRSSNTLKEFYSKMDDKLFDAYMKAIKEGRDYVSVIMDNLNGCKITIENNLAVAEKIGYKFFHRIWQTDAATGVEYLSNDEYLVIMVPVRRQIQTLMNKISIPEDNRHVDELTDQPTGSSKGSAISFPELLVMYSSGAPSAIEELIRFRGGDLKLMNAMDQQIHSTGGASMTALSEVSRTRVKSTRVLSTFFTAMHLNNNF